MVDFQNSNAVGAPAADITRVLVLERRYYVIEAIKNYQRLLNKGMTVDSYEIKAGLAALFLEQQGAFRRNFKQEDEFMQIAEELLGDNKITYERCVVIFWKLNEILDKVKITQLDTKRQYDSTLVTDEDEEKGT